MLLEYFSIIPPCSSILDTCKCEKASASWIETTKRSATVDQVGSFRKALPPCFPLEALWAAWWDEDSQDSQDSTSCDHLPMSRWNHLPAIWPVELEGVVQFFEHIKAIKTAQGMSRKKKSLERLKLQKNIKRCSSKSSKSLPIARIPCYVPRWVQFCQYFIVLQVLKFQP